MSKVNCPSCKREFHVDGDIGRYYEDRDEDFRCLMCRYQGPKEFFKPQEPEVVSERNESEDNKKNSKNAGGKKRSTRTGVRSERAPSGTTPVGENASLAKDSTDGSVR